MVRPYGYVAASRFKAKTGIYLFGKVRRTDWLPVRDSTEAMLQDQLQRSEESDSDYNSEDEEAMVRSNQCGDYGSESNDSEPDMDLLNDEDLANYVDSCKQGIAFWDELQRKHSMPGYQRTGLADSSIA